MKKPVKVPSSKGKPAAAPIKSRSDSAPGKRASSAPSDSKAVASPMAGEEQAGAFDAGMRLFHAREFSKAKLLFEKAAGGPEAEVAHAAQMHARMCERRLNGGGVVLQSPEDRYNYGVALMNQGRLAEAAEQLRAAVSENDRAGHYHYALALCCALQGDAPGSAGHLRRAIEIEPGNRIAAINDPDFQRVASHPSLRDLLAAERSIPG